MAKAYLAAKLGFMGSAILFFSLLIASLHTTSAQIGVCYGRSGDNLPSQGEVVAMFKQYNIKKMRIYEPDPPTLEALRDSDIELTVGIHNEDLQGLAASQDNANTWVQNNIKNYNNVQFRYITVGNEVNPSEPAAQFLVNAMQNINNAIVAAGLGDAIKVTTPIGTGSLAEAYPPSKGYFKPEYRPLIIDPVIDFLVRNQAPLFVNIYPFAAYNDDEKISLEYALFESQTPVVFDDSYQYFNLFDALLDAVNAAVDKVKAEKNIIGRKLLANGDKIIVGESGWPSNGHGRRKLASVDSGAANVNDAGTYYQNLIKYVKEGKGTPRKPGVTIETYLFAMFDENNKPANGEFDVDIERSFGLFSPDKQPKYGIVNFN